MASKQIDIIVPSSPADCAVLFAAIKEISNSMTRVESEKDFQKDAIDTLHEKFEGIDKKYLRQMANDFHKDTFEQRSEEQSAYSDLYEAVVKPVSPGYAPVVSP